MLIYAFFVLKNKNSKKFSVRLKIFLVVLAITGILATFGKHLIYLLTSGAIVFVALAKEKTKKDGDYRMDNSE